MKKLLTKQLILEEVRREHLPQIFEIWSDAEAGKYMHDSHWTSVDELDVILEANKDDDYFGFAALLPESDCVVATCRISKHDDEWDIGYNVRKTHWGKGYATEMVRALIEFAKGIGATAIVTTVAQENIASCRVLEKCGFVVEGTGSFTKKSTDVVLASSDYRLVLT